MILLVFILFSILAGIDFLGFLIKKKRIFGKFYTKVIEVAVVIGSPWFFLYIFDIGLDNDCCNDSAVFSPEHSSTIYFWIITCTIAYFYCSFRKQIAPPIIEVLTNCLLLLGIILNVFLAFHLEDFFIISGNLPIILMFIIVLIQNNSKAVDLFDEENYNASNKLVVWSYQILTLPPVLKYSLLLVISLPILVVAGAILLLFGQKPDSAIRAFTDTYSHGLSQWDYMCDNVICGGHYLCSVAANGHKEVVKPIRFGVRNDGIIVCNRQLLISNAFEELIEEKLPWLHKIIRRNYNHIGNAIHKHYHIFEKKYLSDVIYILMKPLEFIFWLTLYMTVRNPENRIAKQYISKSEKQLLNEL